MQVGYREQDERGRTLVRTRLIELRMRLLGPRTVGHLLAALAEQPGVVSVETGRSTTPASESPQSNTAPDRVKYTATRFPPGND